MPLFRRIRNALDVKSWDNLFPLGVITAFVLLGVPVALGLIDFGLAGKDAGRYQVIYTDIGIQTTAGIFAIVISLSLVAIQFAAQEYSHRIMENYIRSVIFWSTLVVYLGTIIAAILLQTASDGQESSKTVGLVVIASILAVVLLIPHFIVTASYLKPDFIIKKLLRRITPRYIRHLKLDGAGAIAIAPRNDRLLPVVELTERSIDRGDLTTTRSAIDRIIALQADLKLTVPGPVTDRYFADHLTRIGRKAVNQSDEEEAGARAIEALERTGIDGAPLVAAERIDLLGFIALRHGADGAVEQMITSLAAIARAGNDAALDQVLDSYQALVGRLASGGYDQLLILLANCADELNTIDIAHPGGPSGPGGSGGSGGPGGPGGTGGVPVLARSLDCLEAIGHDAAENRLIRVVLRVTNLLRDRAIAIAPAHPLEANATVLRMLRIEHAVDRSERVALAVIGFARSEVERVAGSPVPTGSDAPQPTTDDDGQGGPEENTDGPAAPEGFSDLWDEH